MPGVVTHLGTLVPDVFAPQHRQIGRLTHDLRIALFQPLNTASATSESSARSMLGLTPPTYPTRFINRLKAATDISLGELSGFLPMLPIARYRVNTDRRRLPFSGQGAVAHVRQPTARKVGSGARPTPFGV